MIISLIVAMDLSGGIGKKGALPWRLSADLKRFKALTMGHYMIMGRKTYDSIGRPLPGRTTLVITRNPQYQPVAGDNPAPDLIVSFSLDEALATARFSGESEVFVIGGGEIFELALPKAERIYLTRVQARLDCDTFFPELNLADWRLLAESFHPADEKNEYATIYQLLSRTRS